MCRQCRGRTLQGSCGERSWPALPACPASPLSPPRLCPRLLCTATTIQITGSGWSACFATLRHLPSPRLWSPTFPSPTRTSSGSWASARASGFCPALPLSLVALGKALYLPSLSFLLCTMGTVLPPPGCSGEKMKECTQSSGQGPAIEGFHDCQLRIGPGARPWLGVRGWRLQQFPNGGPAPVYIEMGLFPQEGKLPPAHQRCFEQWRAVTISPDRARLGL